MSNRTVGTLLDLGSKLGIPSPWDLEEAAAPPASGSVNSPFFTRPPLDVADLHETRWTITGVARRGAISTIVGPGGVSKTTLMIALAVDAAAGRSRSGPFSIQNQDEGLRVGLISAEEGDNQLGLLINAAMQAAAMTAAERQNVRQNLLSHDANESGLLIGAPRPGQRETFCPENEDRWLNQLKAALSDLDIIFIDNFAAVFSVPSENDNQSVRRFYGG